MGGGGADRLDGGSGRDRLDGGAGRTCSCCAAGAGETWCATSSAARTGWTCRAWRGGCASSTSSSAARTPGSRRAAPPSCSRTPAPTASTPTTSCSERGWGAGAPSAQRTASPRGVGVRPGLLRKRASLLSSLDWPGVRIPRRTNWVIYVVPSLLDGDANGFRVAVADFFNSLGWFLTDAATPRARTKPRGRNDGVRRGVATRARGDHGVHWLLPRPKANGPRRVLGRRSQGIRLPLTRDPCLAGASPRGSAARAVDRLGQVIATRSSEGVAKRRPGSAARPRRGERTKGPGASQPGLPMASRPARGRCGAIPQATPSRPGRAPEGGQRGRTGRAPGHGPEAPDAAAPRPCAAAHPRVATHADARRGRPRRARVHQGLRPRPELGVLHHGPRRPPGPRVGRGTARWPSSEELAPPFRPQRRAQRPRRGAGRRRDPGLDRPPRPRFARVWTGARPRFPSAGRFDLRRGGGRSPGLVNLDRGRPGRGSPVVRSRLARRAQGTAHGGTHRRAIVVTRRLTRAQDACQGNMPPRKGPVAVGDRAPRRGHRPTNVASRAHPVHDRAGHPPRHRTPRAFAAPRHFAHYPDGFGALPRGRIGGAEAKALGAKRVGTPRHPAGSVESIRSRPVRERDLSDAAVRLGSNSRTSGVVRPSRSLPRSWRRADRLRPSRAAPSLGLDRRR